MFLIVGTVVAYCTDIGIKHLLFLAFLYRFINMEADHAKSLDIAANRTLTERNRITELLRDIDENRYVSLNCFGTLLKG